MSYKRVIPRDLFNEGNLLKCYGRLWIELEKIGLEYLIKYDDLENHFNIVQDESGFTSIYNIKMDDIELYRPLNSRYEWPLYALVEEDIEFNVFDDEGNLSDDFKTYLQIKEA